MDAEEREEQEMSTRERYVWDVRHYDPGTARVVQTNVVAETISEAIGTVMTSLNVSVENVWSAEQGARIFDPKRREKQT